MKNHPLKHKDEELMKLLEIDRKTLTRFKQIREQAMAEAKKLSHGKAKPIKVLGVSGSARNLYDTSQENSNSGELLKRCLKYCDDLGVKTEFLELRKQDIRHCRACYSTTNTQCHFYCSCYPKGKSGDDMTNIIYDKILEADAIIFATPVNNFKISSLMSTFIDRCISLDGSLYPANPEKPKDKELNIKHMKFVELTADNNLPGSGMLRRFSGKIAGIIATGHEEGAAMAISSLFMTLNHYGMLFPPFSNLYAMSSVCLSTYKDKPIVLSDCPNEELKALAKNIVLAAKLAKTIKATDWKNDYTAN